MNRPIQILMLVPSVGCGLVGGVAFAFSAFIMPGLDRLAPTQSIAAMQSINKLAVTPAFMLALMGTAACCLAVGAWAATSLGESWAPWALAGSLLYLLGMIVVTMAANVPLNDALATVDAHAAGGAQRWNDFMAGWMPWNHLRAVACSGACAALAIAVRLA